MLTSQNVLVTGGSGFLGKAIVHRLVRDGARVTSFSRHSDPELTALDVEQYQADVSDSDAVDAACRNQHVVFHTAAKPPPWGKYKDYFRINVTGTQNIIDSCIRRNVPLLVYTSTPSVIFNGSDLNGVDESIPYPARYTADYPKTKAMAEKRVIEAGSGDLSTIILRPHQIWGPGDPHFAPRLLARAKKLKQIGDGTNLVDTIYIDNAADAHLLAAKKLGENPSLSGRVYFITQGEPVPAWDMINAILNAAGMQPVTGQVSYTLARSLGAVLEFIYRTLRLPGEPQMTRFLAEAVAKSHWFDIRAAKTDLNFTPRISTAEGLERLAEWFQSNKMQ